jgi:hypothetical protein
LWPDPVGVSLLPQVALVGLQHLGKLSLDCNLDAELGKVREKLSPLRVAPDMNAPRPMRSPG